MPEKLSMAAPQKVDAMAMQMPAGEPAMLPSQMDSTTPSVRMISESTSKPVGTCAHVLPCHPSFPVSALSAACAAKPPLNEPKVRLRDCSTVQSRRRTCCFYIGTKEK